jgi:hypothetical protein
LNTIQHLHKFSYSPHYPLWFFAKTVIGYHATDSLFGGSINVSPLNKIKMMENENTDPKNEHEEDTSQEDTSQEEPGQDGNVYEEPDEPQHLPKADGFDENGDPIYKN